ncbi:MAG: Hsp70 protein, partial [Harvfovirus sp.]
ASVKGDLEFLTYEIESGDGGDILLNNSSQGVKHTPEEISAMVLSRLKVIASNYLKMDVKKAVITVPAYFNDAQRQATKDAATIAGLDCIRIINEPTAAALAYGVFNRSKQLKPIKKEMNIIVYDFGGGTLDVSLLNVSSGLFEVLASVGNTHLGGADFDKRLMRYCLHMFKNKYSIAKLDNVNVLSIQRLKRSCENAKKMLSHSIRATIAVKDFFDSKDLFINVSQDKLVELCRDLLLISIDPLREVLDSAMVTKDVVDEIILVGGMTRMPIIRENIKRFFNSKEANTSLNPDEAVCIGAAIQGYKLSHDCDPFAESMTLLDITALSLGVEIIGGVMSNIIKRNTVIPVNKTKMYTTNSDFETSVIIKIFEGERKLTKNNFLVGEFELKGIEPKMRGLAKIEVKFHIDVNGIITVTAEDKDSKSKNGVTISGNKGRLSTSQVEKLVRDAREYELKDKVEAARKEYLYEIEELCSNIKLNIESGTLNLSIEDKAKVIGEVGLVERWAADSKVEIRGENEYKEVRDKLKKNYGLLIFNSNSDVKEPVKANVVMETNATSIYGEDVAEVNEVFEKLENEEHGFISDDDKKEIKGLRDCLKELANSLFDMLSSQNLQLSDDDVIELKENIDDVLLWMHVHTKATAVEYKAKIDHINDQCDAIMKKYDGLFKKDVEENGKDELEQLCLLIKSSLSCGMFSVNENDGNLVGAKVDEILDWLISGKSPTENEYGKYILEVNELCNKVYSNSLVNVSVRGLGEVQKETTPFVDPIEDDIGGTSIASILSNKILSD